MQWSNILRVHYKSMKCDVSISQCSVSTLFRWDEHVFHECVKCSSRLQMCKNYKNQTSFFRVMITNVLPRFFIKHNVRLGNHMWPIEYHQYQWTWVAVKVTVAVQNLSDSYRPTSENIACLRDRKARMWPVISTVASQLKDFSKSQAVTYTAKVVISRKWCKITMFYYRPLIGSDIRPIKLRHFRWPWVISWWFL